MKRYEYRSTNGEFMILTREPLTPEEEKLVIEMLDNKPDELIRIFTVALGYKAERLKGQ